MTDSSAFVATVTSVDRSKELNTPATIHFGNGQSAQLPPGPHSNVIADVLHNLTTTGDPAYVEVGANHIISQVLLPLVGYVMNLETLPSGDLRIDLDDSAALHVLHRHDPKYNSFADVARAAHAANTPVALTEDPKTHRILDLSPAANPKQPVSLLVAPAKAKPKSVPLPAPITSAQATELFALVSATTCNVFTAPAPCIPFLYPDDGCWARASQMCKLMLAQAIPVVKLWYYGNLVVHTDNSPACTLNWIFHVAPLVTIDNGSGRHPYVIDPALFTKPVTQAKWESVLGDPTAIPLLTDPSMFLIYLSGWHRSDPGYVQTDKVLATYRNKLRLRAAQLGPPPYEC